MTYSKFLRSLTPSRYMPFELLVSMKIRYRLPGPSTFAQTVESNMWRAWIQTGVVHDVSRERKN